MMIVRAVRWYRDLARLGLHIPFFLAHDFTHKRYCFSILGFDDYVVDSPVDAADPTSQIT